MSSAETHAYPGVLRGLLPVHPLTPETHETGVPLARGFPLPVCNGMTAALALHAGRERLRSEAMQQGLTLEGRLRIANPFRTS